MEYLKFAGVGLVAVLIAYLTLCILSPEKVAASKTIVVHTNVKSVAANLEDLGTWKIWHPYLDSAQESTIKLDDNTISWTSNSRGSAKVHLTKTDSFSISFTTSFKKNGKWKNYKGEFLFEGNDKETKISWIYVGESFPFLKRPANYVIKDVVEQNMEKGLFRLKKFLKKKSIER